MDINKHNGVVVVSAAYPSKTEPQRAIFISNLVSHLTKREHIFVLAPHIHPEDESFEVVDNVAIKRFGFCSKGTLLKHQGGLPLWQMILYVFSCAYWTYIALKMTKYKKVFVHWVLPTGPGVFIAAKLAKVPYVVMCHGSDINVFATKNIIFRMTTKYILRKSMKIISVSNILKQNIIQHFHIEADKIQVVSCGVDTNVFKPMEKHKARTALNVQLDCRLFIFVGDLINTKGVDTLLDAILKIKDDALYLAYIGDGPLRGKLHDRAQKSELRNNIIFTGPISHEQVALWQNAADTLILPSLNEGMPLAIMEALSCGTPVIASKVGGIPEIVNDKNGILIDPNNTEELVSAIRKLCDNPEYLKELTAGASLTGDKFSLSYIAGRLLKIIHPD